MTGVDNMSEVDELLAAWGRWSKCGVTLAAKNMWSHCASNKKIDICDDVAVEVDRAVAAAGQVNIMWREVLELHYRYDIPLNVLRRRLNADRSVIDKNLAAARGFVTGYLIFINNKKMLAKCGSQL